MRLFSVRTLAPTVLGAALALGCGRSGDQQEIPAATSSVSQRDQPPVPLDENPPVEYPPDLYAEGVSGTVVLRLYVDDQGNVVNDSTRIEDSSGVPGLDSAALAAAPRLHYAPALRGGKPVAAPFKQPIHFRHPGGGDQTP